MGKFNHSILHSIWSDWHYLYCKQDAYLTDIDRMWVELRNNKIIAVFDLKTNLEWENYNEPYSEKIIRTFFENQNIPYFVVVINIEKGTNPVFTVSRKGTTREFLHRDMVEFINNLEEEIKHFNI